MLEISALHRFKKFVHAFYFWNMKTQQRQNFQNIQKAGSTSKGEHYQLKEMNSHKQKKQN